jgi:hypothetical protein
MLLILKPKVQLFNHFKTTLLRFKTILALIQERLSSTLISVWSKTLAVLMLTGSSIRTFHLAALPKTFFTTAMSLARMNVFKTALKYLILL